MTDYLEINRAAWNNRVQFHQQSTPYELNEFIQGKSSLPTLDVQLLGDITGQSILHLQCHFGMDTLSLAKMGAQVTGVDLSDVAITKAIELSNTLDIPAHFICSDIYDLPNILNNKFDIVYTSYGVINWLPNLKQWGSVISHFLKPQGKFILIEFHPILWMLDEDFSHLKFGYSRKEPYISKEPTYTEKGEERIDTTVTWNYGLSEPINALTQNNMMIHAVHEYYESPINLFTKMIETETGIFKIKGWEDKIPLIYSITAQKQGG